MELTKAEKQKLLMGNGAWETHSIDGKIKSITMNDGPHGLRKPCKNSMTEINNSEPATCFPCEASLANSWDPSLAYKLGNQIAKEVQAYGTSVVLGCGANIKRSPLCGRNFEYFSEDPLLAGKMAAAYIKGAQKEGVGTSLKHFAGNNQENCRMISNSEIDERALREIYLRPFEIAVRDSNPATIMASYNYLNGVHATENKELLTDILRTEWNYSGLVMSDWGACTDPVKSHEAGMDLEMPENKYHINPEISEPALTLCAERIKKLTEKFQNSDFSIADKKNLFDESHQIAEEIQAESIVLLKNDGILPFPPHTKNDKEPGREIIIIGQLAEDMRYQGGGSSHIISTHKPGAVKAFRDAGYKVTFFQGYRKDSDLIDKKLEAQVLSGISGKHPLIFIGGLPEKFEGEGYDRTTLSIPQNQIHLLSEICSLRKNVIFVNISGSAVELPFADEVNAIVHTALGGQAGDTALVKIISGQINPSGKLSETFPVKLEDSPSYKYFGTDCDIEYRESIFVGYRYYNTFRKRMAFPFGHGLSYTTFSYFNAAVEQEGVITSNVNMQSSQKPKILFKLKNTGKLSGKEVCQLYIKNPEGNFMSPAIELMGFQKVFLEPGEEKTVAITLNENAFKIWSTKKHEFITVAGEYEIFIGSSSEDIRLALRLQVEGEDPDLNQKDTLPDYFVSDVKDENSFEISREQFQLLYGKPLSDFSHPESGSFSVYSGIRQLAQKSVRAKIVYKMVMAILPLTFKGKPKDDPEVQMCLRTFADCPVEMISAQSGGIIKPSFVAKMIKEANRKK